MIKALQEASEDVVGTLNDFQPYQYVGQLGYYTHWMEPDFVLLQLGVRFYDPEVGRFGQRDPIADDRVAHYAYAWNRVTRVVDPSGRQAVVYPTLVASPSCSDFRGAASFIAAAQQWVKQVVDGLNLSRCPTTITVYCYKKGECGQKVECGKSIPNSGTGAHMHINWAPSCSSPKCLILHEMVHTCGVTGHRWYGAISVPGCQKVGFGP